VCVSVHEERKSVAWVVEYNGPAGRGNGREGRDGGRGDGWRGMGIGEIGCWMSSSSSWRRGTCHCVVWLVEL
jgi:hypothetical protein